MLLVMSLWVALSGRAQSVFRHKFRGCGFLLAPMQHTLWERSSGQRLAHSCRGLQLSRYTRVHLLGSYASEASRAAARDRVRRLGKCSSKAMLDAVVERAAQAGSRGRQIRFGYVLGNGNLSEWFVLPADLQEDPRRSRGPALLRSAVRTLDQNCEAHSSVLLLVSGVSAVVSLLMNSLVPLLPCLHLPLSRNSGNLTNRSIWLIAVRQGPRAAWCQFDSARTLERLWAGC